MSHPTEHRGQASVVIRQRSLPTPTALLHSTLGREPSALLTAMSCGVIAATPKARRADPLR